MGTKFQRLRKEALEMCKTRGHKMKPFFIPYNGTEVKIAESKCKVCGKEVIVDASPAPSNFEIKGDATIKRCNRNV